MREIESHWCFTATINPLRSSNRNPETCHAARAGNGFRKMGRPNKLTQRQWNHLPFPPSTIYGEVWWGYHHCNHLHVWKAVYSKEVFESKRGNTFLFHLSFQFVWCCLKKMKVTPSQPLLPEFSCFFLSFHALSKSAPASLWNNRVNSCNVSQHYH